MSDRIQSYFVSDPGGNYLAPTYPSMSAAQAEADVLNDARDETPDAFDMQGNYVVGAHLHDGSTTFEIG